MKQFYLVAICAVCMLAGGCGHKEEPAATPDFYQEIKSVDKLVFASMSISKIAKLEDNQWYKIGKRIAVYSYDSYMRAYIDLSQLGPDDIVVDTDNKKVTITLPPIQTEVTGRDVTMHRDYENIGLLRSDLDSRERAEMKEQANRSFRKEIEENPRFRDELTAKARRKAVSYFETLFASQGYTADVEFKTSVAE